MAISNSIRGRLLLWLLLPLAIFLVLGELWDFNTADTPANEAFDQSLADTAFALSAHVHAAGDTVRFDISAQTANALRADPQDKIYISVFDPKGQLLFGDGQLAPHLTLPARAATPMYFDTLREGQPIRVALIRYDVGNHPVLIEVGETLHKRERTARKIFWATFIPDTLNALVTLLLVVIGVRFGLRPIKEIRNQISHRSPNDLKPIQLKQTPSELAPLVTALNRLFARVAEASSAQQRFVSNAAHQLRTPLTGLQTQLELLASDPNSTADKAKIERLLHATGRLSHLISQLLMLAKADPASAGTYQFESVDLKALAEAQAESHVDAAVQRNIDLGFECASVPVMGSPWLLREMLSNLIDNALRYVPEGGTVTVRCGDQAGHPFLEVQDNGPGIAEAERERIFDRFYRAESASAEGCGLGLAIVKEIAELHGAEASVHPASPHGALFRVRWPVPDEKKGLAPRQP